jgi:hypothetical protein
MDGPSSKANNSAANTQGHRTAHRADMGIKILDAVMADKDLGMMTKDRVANHVMEVLGIEEGTTV